METEIEVISSIPEEATEGSGPNKENDEKSASTQEVDSKEKDETLEESETSKESEVESKDAESEDEDSQDDEGQEEKRSDLPKGVKKRFKRFQRKLSEKDQEIEYLKGELFRKSQAPKEQQNPAPQEESNDSSEPREEDFENHKDYLKAFIKWETAQERAKEGQKSREAQAKEEYQRALKTHNERVQEFKKTTPDYDDVIEDYVEEHGDVRLSPALTTLISESDLGPQALYGLLKDPEALNQINALPPLAAAREFGKIEAKLSLSSQSQKPKTTKAPPPPSPLGGKSAKAAKKSLSDPNLTQAEFEAIYQEQFG